MVPADDDDDDESLTWAGGRDPSYVETPEPVNPLRKKKVARVRRSAVPGPVLPESELPELGDEVDDDTEDDTDVDHETELDELPPVASAAVLLSLGVLAGVYLLYTVGWIVSLQRMLYFAANSLDQDAFRIQQLLAIAAPLLWFLATLLFTRKHSPVTRLVWLVVGALLLVPWSFIFGS
ncbi:MAG: hypothetical protein QOH44_482 [Actinomycetota bacterium]|jgi:hypothetical protein|nr:hypothetical protein [Actinomycetota bacterium]